ncbi:hypothetical protein AB205_0048790 [Aquarana catesbeiana]|uniref:Uncharacterized protein n=1 Tax=Aquarana catesbeiana TaxID=8400 RepID=A0A2G9QL45_AQUCT|nr:hypothetical protein AB205_0048790 [Aquarana catesbeiana]
MLFLDPAMQARVWLGDTAFGPKDGSLKSVAYASMIPLQTLQNFLRLVEQYHNVIFQGPEGSLQEYIVDQLSCYIKNKEEGTEFCCDVVKVEVDSGLSKEQLVDIFINSGCLIPVTDSPPCKKKTIIILEKLENVSLLELLGDLMSPLENRGSENPYCIHRASGLSDAYYFHEDCFLMGTVARPRLQGPELLVQQHFRWVQLRWDGEPMHSLLHKVLKRRVVHKVDVKIVECSNCAKIKRSSILGHVAPINTPSQGQQAVVRAALSILLNKAILHGCHLPKNDVEQCLADFKGGHFSLSMSSTYKPGGKKKGENGAWRKVSTSPRKKSNLNSSWSQDEARQEGGISKNDLKPASSSSLTKQKSLECVHPKTLHMEQRLSAGSDDEMDLVKELRAMCSSKSEPDITKIADLDNCLVIFKNPPNDQKSAKSKKQNSQKPRKKPKIGLYKNKSNETMQKPRFRKETQPES